MRGGRSRTRRRTGPNPWGVAVLLGMAGLGWLGIVTPPAPTRPADDDQGPTIDCLFDGGLMDCAGLNPDRPQ